MRETNERRMGPERPETRPPKNPVRHRTTTTQQATARQHDAAEAIVLHANALPNRQDGLRTSKATTRFREGQAKTSEKYERSERSERHERPTRPERLKTRPPEIPVHQYNPTRSPPEQSPRKIRVKAEFLRVWTDTMVWILCVNNTTIQEEITKASEKSIRYDRSKRPDNLIACARNYPRRLFKSPRLHICLPPGLAACRNRYQQDIENAEGACAPKIRFLSTQILQIRN